jgi:predicted dinucleotide-binding enzyme
VIPYIADGEDAMKPKIAIIGKGNVGSALKRGLDRAGYDVRNSGKEAVKETAAWGEIIILAVPFVAIDDVVHQLAEAVDKKIVVDATNSLTPDMRLALGFSTSGAEELQKKAAGARIVKAFNTVFAQHMDKGTVAGQQLTIFAASDDQEARAAALEMGKAIGFDPVDAGPLSNARQLEALGYFNIQLGYVLGNGTDVGFKFIH